MFGHNIFYSLFTPARFPHNLRYWKVLFYCSKRQLFCDFFFFFFRPLFHTLPQLRVMRYEVYIEETTPNKQYNKSWNGLENDWILSQKLCRNLISSFSFNYNYLDLLMQKCTQLHIADLPSYMRIYWANTMWPIISSKPKANHVFPWARLSRYSRLLPWHLGCSSLFSTVPPGFIPTFILESSMLLCACISCTVAHMCN